MAVGRHRNSSDAVVAEIEAVADKVPIEPETTFASRAAMGRMLEEHEVGRSFVAMLLIPGMTGADIDLSCGMIAR